MEVEEPEARFSSAHVTLQVDTVGALKEHFQDKKARLGPIMGRMHYLSGIVAAPVVLATGIPSSTTPILKKSFYQCLCLGDAASEAYPALRDDFVQASIHAGMNWLYTRARRNSELCLICV